MKTTRHNYSSPYCLHCYAPLERFDGASSACGACGSPNLRVDLARLWTREHKLRVLENWLKALVCLAMIAIGGLALLFPGTGVGKGHGMAIGAPIVLGILLWDTASITRKQSLFQLQIVWPIVGWLLGVPMIWLVLVLGGKLSVPLQMTLLVTGVVTTLSAITSPWLRRWWSSWCERRIVRAQA